MDFLFNLVSFILVCFTLSGSSILAQDVCVRKSACVCEFSNGTGIDLRPSSAQPTFFSALAYRERAVNGSIVGQYELTNYFYHPCTEILLPEANDKINDEHHCGWPVSICRHVKEMLLVNDTLQTYKLNDSRYEFLGNSSKSFFTSDGHSIIYNNDSSNNTVLLVCTQGKDEMHVTSLAEPNNIVLTFYSRNACLVQVEQPGRSVGSTLLIIFFSLVIVYLVLGVCTKKFLMGATGIEVVPNLAFWSDLPNLVKDGWAFAISGFKLPVRGAGPTASPDPNSYDSI